MGRIVKVLEGVGAVSASCLEISMKARVHRGWKVVLHGGPDSL